MKADLGGPLLRSVSRSFYLSIKVLPRAVREPIALAYLLARASDTIADTEQVSALGRLEGLRIFREMISGGKAALLPPEIAPQIPAERELLKRLPECLAWLQSVPAQDRADIEEVLGKINRGQELDVRRFELGEGIGTAQELEEYTYLVAGCVGEFWTRVCFRHIAGYSSAESLEMERLGRSFGQGLQLVNILRDLPADLRAGRCYLPREEIGKQDAVRMRASFSHWIKQAELHLADGFSYLENVRTRRLRYACFLPWRLGVLTLRLIKSHPPLKTAQRMKVPRRTVRATMLAGLLVAGSQSFLRRYRAIH